MAAATGQRRKRGISRTRPPTGHRIAVLAAVAVDGRPASDGADITVMVCDDKATFSTEAFDSTAFGAAGLGLPRPWTLQPPLGGIFATFLMSRLHQLPCADFS